MARARLLYHFRTNSYRFATALVVSVPGNIPLRLVKLDHGKTGTMFVALSCYISKGKLLRSTYSWRKTQFQR